MKKGTEAVTIRVAIRKTRRGQRRTRRVDGGVGSGMVVSGFGSGFERVNGSEATGTGEGVVRFSQETRHLDDAIHGETRVLFRARVFKIL